MVVVSETRILSHVRGITDGPGEAPPLETSSCRIGFSILWGPASWVPGLPRRRKFADEFSHLSPWGALQARSVAAVGRLGGLLGPRSSAKEKIRRRIFSFSEDRGRYWAAPRRSWGRLGGLLGLRSSAKEPTTPRV